MKIVKSLRHCLGVIKRKIKLSYELKYHSITYSIINKPYECFEIYKTLKPESWENTVITETYNLNKKTIYSGWSERLDILLLDNAIVKNRTDIVITDKGCLLDKAENPNFGGMILEDVDLLRHSRNELTLRNTKEKEFIDGKVVSLLGIFSTLWAHFIIQFLPKLLIAIEKGILLDKEVVILVPFYKDNQIREIISIYADRYPHVTIKIADDKYSYVCKKLYYIPSLTVQVNQAAYIHPHFCVFTNLMKDLLSKHFIDLFVEKANQLVTPVYSKIYLPRVGYHRTIVNHEEVDQYFKNNGFEFIYPDKLSLLEKIRIFNNADIIAGPLSGGFTNAFFCRKNAKILGFSNIPRTLESYLGSISTINSIQVLSVTGYDLDGRNIHTSYYIPLERIIKAYNYLLTNTL